MSHVHVVSLQEVEKEHAAVQAALEYLGDRWSAVSNDPDLMALTLPDLRRARQNLQRTYLMRVFARFEALVRDALGTAGLSRRIPRTADALIRRAGSHWRVTDVLREDVHRVREFRNQIVHERPPSEFLTLRDAVRFLSRFLVFIP